MRNYHLRRNSKWCPTINLDKLWTLVSEQTRLKYKDHPDGKAPVVDIVKAVSVILLRKLFQVLEMMTVNGRTDSS
jgi:large subunit ribosomal protein L27Ae